jgi:DNA-binding beta-propeller fold protein YncE
VKKIAILFLALIALRLLPKALRSELRFLATFSALAKAMLVMAVDNTSKVMSIEGRTGDLETRVGNLEQGQIPNLDQNSLIGGLTKGIFPNVQGNTVIMTAASSSTLHCQALGNLTDSSNTSFLSGLSKTQSPGGVALDPNSGTTWVANERAQYINDLRSDWNSLLGTFINNGFMNSA